MPKNKIIQKEGVLPVAAEQASKWAWKSVRLNHSEVLIVVINGVSIRIDADELAREAESTRTRITGEDRQDDAVGDDASVVSLSDIFDHAVQQRLEERMPSEARDYYASLGPWVTGNAVKQTFGVSWQTLKNWREKHLLLGVEFADQKYYYPAKQFRDGRVVPGLQEVLDALAPAFVAPASRAGWLARLAYAGEQLSRWDVLREGATTEVVAWAREDADRVVAA